MFNSGFGNNGDFESMARQYWSAWGDAMRQGGMSGMGGAAARPASQWQQAVDWWTQLMPGERSQANDAVGRFNQQASQWFGQMQQVAAQFAGQDSNPADISQAWRRAMGAHGDNPFPDLFKAMRGQGAHGLDDWLEQVKPYLDSFQQNFQQQGKQWQQLPAFGQYREHQERWQALQLAQQEYQQQSEAFNALLAKCATRAFEVFEDKLTAHDGPGRQITSARGLFDLWIDSAEEAYAGIALSPEFREVYGALGNAQMRLRAAIQLEVEHMTGLFGMPTRTEIDSAHRKIAELERTLRRAAAAGKPTVAERKAAAAPTVPAAPTTVISSKPKARRTARKQAVARKAAERKPAASKHHPVKQTVARKAAAKPAVITEKAGARKASASASAKPVVAKARPAKKVATKKATKPASVKADAKAGAAPKAAPRKKAAPQNAAAQKSAPASTSNRVVSMRDWVARYAAMNTPQGPGSNTTGRDKGARK
jgi:class III poly(R)-hydroxyalkanoic acid synthase PhaE subunit